MPKSMFVSMLLDLHKDTIIQEKGRLYRTVSELTIKANTADDGAAFTCEADHNALEETLKTSFRLSVLCKLIRL